jgi:hypothetical protein
MALAVVQGVDSILRALLARITRLAPEVSHEPHHALRNAKRGRDLAQTVIWPQRDQGVYLLSFRYAIPTARPELKSLSIIRVDQVSDRSTKQ